ncbi:gamma-glutamyl hydrolase B-like [Convolutriloba macropyga]|uniref:gamma-glutamyl hydrolase B-like n=1 Tax=Convolutriloba macropyga TaxID=536237 RepID=UPI003F51F562
MRHTSIVLFLVATLNVVTAKECTNNRPVVGILSQDLNEDGYPPSSNYIASSYVKFVEMFAAQVVPILPNRPQDYYDYLLPRLNGVVLPGGSVSLYSGSYHTFAQKAFDYSEKVFNESGEIFPILGICLGFEELSTLAAGNHHVMSNTDSYGLLTTLEITDYGFNQSKLLKHAPGWLLNAMQNMALAPNFHHYGLTPNTYEQNSGIQEVFEAVAYSYDKENVKFVAILEGKSLPFLGYQFHPEKNLFEWYESSTYPLAHDFYGAAFSQYLGDYFIQQTKKSCQAFESQDDLEPYLIYNYNQTYSLHLFSNFHFVQMYIFDSE